MYLTYWREEEGKKKGDLMTNTVHKAKHTEINDIH